MIASWVSPRRFFIAAKVNGKFFRLRIQVANDYATAIQFDAGAARLVGYGTDRAYPRPAGEELHRHPRRRRNFQLSGGQRQDTNVFIELKKRTQQQTDD